MSAPLYTRLINYHKQNRISFAMPGHKNGRGLKYDLLDCDVTELDATENLHHPHEFIAESKRLLSELFHSDESFIVTCGSTACIQAMIAASVKRGGTLLAAADCHMSVINACALLGINLKIIPRETDGIFFAAKRLCDIENYMDGADAVIITSPTYYGLCADIEKISRQCHKRGIPLLVDEAHGAHFTADSRLPQPAIMRGADLVCQSAHKTLNALTGAAFLHARSNLINRERLKKALVMFQTSSPSYVIAASADLAREELERGGWEEIISECESFREELSAKTEIKILDNDDRARLVLNFSAYEATGFDIGNILSADFKTDVEMADLFNIVLIVTPSNTAEDLKTLYSALINITEKLEKRRKPLQIPSLPSFEGAISMKDVFFRDTKKVLLDESIGKISAAAVTSYPPGIPVIYMGAEITDRQLEYIAYLQSAGAEITGIENGAIEILD